MKILHIATYQKGGAAIAAIRLHRALLTQGYDSKFLFLECTESDTFFRFRKTSFLNKLFWKIIRKFEIPLSLTAYKIRKNKGRFETFSFAKTKYTDLHEHPLVKDADVINLHWVANFLDYTSFFAHIKKPVFWTLHDMQPFQGGFHYHEDEIRNNDLLLAEDQEQYAVKEKALGQIPASLLTVVAPSKWLLNESRNSRVLGRFPHRHIPYSIDTETFRIGEGALVRKQTRNLKDKLTVVFVCEMLDNPRKGFEMVLELLMDQEVASKFVFLAVGKVKPADQIPEITYLGSITTEKKMSEIYNSADLFIIPSREDNLPNTMIESLCCGTPVVGFRIGGLRESINQMENGVLSDEVSVAGLKNALLSAAERIGEFNPNQISLNAHDRYAVDRQVEAYTTIYEASCKPETIAFQG